jgi:predicted dehydrogenase
MTVIDKQARPVRLVLVGTGGMGAAYLKSLLEETGSGRYRIEGLVDPFPKRCPYLDRVREMEIPVYPGFEHFYSQKTADLAIVSSPIHFHSIQTIIALDHQSHVLCEKPAAATIQDVRRMIEARDRSRRWVAIGYQWSWSAAVERLKTDIMDGAFGKPIRLKCLYLWPRDEAYYRRTDWAGKKRSAIKDWILDSPANNAMAHDLHNMFYVLGAARDRSAKPVWVEAELYRAYDIENFDTIAARSFTDSGAEILFFASHACQKDSGPVFDYEFEKGVIFGRGRNTDILASFRDGSVKNYGSPDASPMKKLWDSLAAVGTEGLPLCGLEAAASQTLCINGMQDSMPEPKRFPQNLLRHETGAGGGRIWVSTLDETLELCYRKNSLPGQLDIPWSSRGKKIDLSRYRNFPGSSP